MSFHNTKYCKELGCIHCGTKPKGKTSKSEMKRLKIQKAAREFWIFKGTSNFCSTLILDENCETESKAKPEGFYDVVALADTVEGGIHVREVLPNEIVLDRATADALYLLVRGAHVNYEVRQNIQDTLEAALKGKE